MVFFLYSLGISLLQLFLTVGSFFSAKLGLMVDGQKNTLRWLASSDRAFRGHQVVWMHCSSLGEFEQGRPVLEKLRVANPGIKIVLSFFSPSGYEIRKSWEGADYIFYLPADTRANAVRLIQKIQPDLFILVKYDFWWNLLREMKKQAVPVFLTAALYNSGKYYYKNPFLSILQSWQMIFTLRASHAEGFKKRGIKKVIAAGDPRVDRVIDIQEKGVHIPDQLQAYLQDKPKVILYGSVWPSDIAYIKENMHRHPEWMHVVVPHDISSSHVADITRLIGLEYDLLSTGTFQKNILVIDRIGLLSGLYRFASMAYVGGGFGKGIHNTLEAAVHGIPVCFGPTFKAFPEAGELIESGAGFVITSPAMFTSLCEKFIGSPREAEIIKQNLQAYFEKNKGAADSIVIHIQKQLLQNDK